MSATQITSTEKQAIRRVIERATVNPDARQLALTDPHAAVRDFGGAELPAEITVEFVERAPDIDALIVLPPAGHPVEFEDGSEQEKAIFEPVLKRAQSDTTFRRLAVSDAAAAIKQATGADVPAHTKIAFYDQAANVDLVVVLPPLVEDGGALDEAELEMVAGGVADCFCTSCLVFSGGFFN